MTKIVRVVGIGLGYLAMGMMLVMMFLGTADVLGRDIFNKPIVGTYEIYELLMPGITLCGLAYTQLGKGHVTLDIVSSRFSPRLRARISFAITLILLCLFGLMTWQGTITAIGYWEQGRQVVNLHIPFFIFALCVPIGAMALCLVFSLELYRYFRPEMDTL